MQGTWVRATSFSALMAGIAVTGCSSGTTSSTTTQAPQVQVTVTGPAQVRLGSTVQLYAVISNSSNSSVTWQVNGVAGGDSVNGTISSAGLYTPPAKMPSANPVTISAVSAATPT